MRDCSGTTADGCTAGDEEERLEAAEAAGSGAGGRGGGGGVGGCLKGVQSKPLKLAANPHVDDLKFTEGTQQPVI